MGAFTNEIWSQIKFFEKGDFVSNLIFQQMCENITETVGYLDLVIAGRDKIM